MVVRGTTDFCEAIRLTLSTGHGLALACAMGQSSCEQTRTFCHPGLRGNDGRGIGLTTERERE